MLTSRLLPARSLVALGACALGLAVGAPSASAATFNAACSGTTGNPSSLIAAIRQANTATGPDAVRLGQRCTYALGNPDNGWYGPTALPAIASDVTVEGNGSTITRAAMAPRSRLFFVGADPAAPATLNYVTPGPGKLTLRNVILRGGHAKGGDATAGGGGGGMGGAIFSQGRVTIDSSTLTANTAQGGEGGGTAGGNAGGGIGVSSNGSTGGGMGGSGPPMTPTGGAGGPVGGGAGGGAGLRTGQNGAPGGGSSGSPGGRSTTPTGTGGQSGSNVSAGDGSGGGGNGTGTGTLVGGSGGAFGRGGTGPNSGGGGGAGGGGGSTQGAGATGGGGGFGGGGGWGIAGGGAGGFGGGAGGHGAVGAVGQPGFGGGAAQEGPARGGGGAGLGGAVFNMQGSLTVRNSTLTANTAQGGASNGSPDPGKGFGGAVFNLSGAFTAVGSTLAANTAVPNTANAEGTAVYNLAYDAATARTAQTTLRNTILGEGTGDDTLVSNRSAFITPSPNLGTANAAVGERNLVRTSSVLDGGTLTGTALTTDPRLGALGNNGGPTPTMAPAQNSPAIDAGAAFGLTRDQRGLTRPSNFLDVPNAADGSDIGAVERQAPAAPAAPGAGGATPLPTFGSRARISLTLAARRIPARGPVPVRVVNANTFTVKGRLLGQTTRRQLVRRGGAKRFVKLPSSRTFTLDAGTRRTVRLRLPGFLRRQLVRRRRLSLRIAASVQDPAGKKRTVRKTIGPKLRRPRRR